MAMSKCCFFTLLGLILCGIIAAVVGVIMVQMKSEDGVDASKEEAVPEKIEGEMLSELCAGFPTKSTLLTSKVGPKKPEMGISSMGMQTFKDPRSGEVFKRNAFWFTGDDENDRISIAGIKAKTCQGHVPVIVFKMRPKGLTLTGNAKALNHYKPDPPVDTWKDYDRLLSKYLSVIANVPAVIIMEPDLLMYAYDQRHQQYRWKNEQFEDEFLLRVQRIIRNMPQSWVYVDAGNAAYLSNEHNIDQMARTLLRVNGLRGFTLNSLHYFNTTFNNRVAGRLHCKTGLHFLIDTGRNGGEFSRQGGKKINQCLFDPPNIKAGSSPGWSWGVRSEIIQARRKRWIMTQPTTRPPTSRTSGIRITSAGYGLRTTTNRFANGAPPASDIDAYNQYINQLNNNKNNEADMLNNRVNSGNNFNVGLPPTNPHAVAPNPNTVHQSLDYASPPAYNPPNSGLYNNMITSQPIPITAASMLRPKGVAGTMFGGLMDGYSSCVRQNPVKAHDGNVWLKTAGESDGRMFPFGTYHKCLIGHKITCTDTCKLLVDDLDNQADDCNCEKAQRTTTFSHNANYGQQHNSNNPFMGGQDNFGAFDQTNEVYPPHNANGGMYPRTSLNTGSASLSDLLQAAAGR